MLPLKDDVRTRSFPGVSVSLIAVNAIIYLYEFFLWFEPATPGRPPLGQQLYAQFVAEFGLIPCRFGDICPLNLETALAGAPAPTLTIFTSMFVHGGLLHVGGNMLYLWIFGKNVEDSMGHGRFVAFYLVCGLAAAAAQYLQNPASAVPMVGASGAVSGTLGAYLVLHPHARIWTLVIFGFFVRVIPVPALVVLGFWVVLQFANSVFTFGRGDTGGVAFLAHLGGFIVGLLLINVFRSSRIRGRRRHGL
ncbi:MAG TPA: rhomboid family intramembrane serine protease [Methylomirabilota bacterium]|nr:rhomboid family intramembrane serine protease [Methylomirabilota bacterium]